MKKKLEIFYSKISYNRKKSKGFTLIEILVSVGIIILLTALIFPSYKSGEAQFVLDRSANKLAQDLRRAQEMAMSMKEENCNGVKANGYGIHFNISWKDAEGNYYYKLFANCNNNHHRDNNDKDLEEIKLERGIEINNLFPADNFSILFVPPDPCVWINSQSSGIEAQIVLARKDNPSEKRTIKINNSGLIEVE